MILITASVTHAQSNEFTIPLTDPAKRGKLKASLHTGSITIKGTTRKDVLVKYRSEDEEDDDDRDDKRASDGLKRVSGGGMDLEASEINNSVRVGSGGGSNNNIHLEIEVPSGFDLDVSTHNDGDLMITNIQGELELKNHNGKITALNISGAVLATSYNDDIKVTFDKVTENMPMSFSTYNGNLDLTFPASLKASFKMKTEQGDIYTGFDMNITSTGPVQKKDTKSGTFKIVIDDWKKGDVNGGGPEFTLKNYNGDIYVRKK
ncbi:DUF4097 family beta strand repeat protein [Fulvivirgaceae bacterium PWU4]|uniref:DUF4097 family beta strand repeat protein n=1 Tax=Chryseosolibacter histidini TaxID=2782349 RepID=A0AAP2DR39_9BACT|nr:DUF4097 family beta strand repeat-containing protein [Chryseosolibacter histidini]MBT1699793.1 DUF4097 family beta strand repeat protein [Chryseosolibacter histidini]